MLTRIVSLVLIAAVIACPLSCGLGMCQGESCCLAEVSPPAHCSCCAAEESCDGSFPKENEPFQPPCESSCQGICGGAVFEKPCQLNDPDDACFSLLPESHVFLGDQQASSSSWDATLIRLGDAGNYGRFMRTLHGSLLC